MFGQTSKQHEIRSPNLYTKYIPCAILFLSLGSFSNSLLSQSITGSSVVLTSGTPDVNFFDNLGTSQHWRMFASSSKFGIEDKTNFPSIGDNILVLETNARNSALYMASDDYLGLGTDSPDAYLDVRGAAMENSVKLNPGVATSPSLEITETVNSADIVLETVGSARWQIKTNAATGRLTFKDLHGTTTPFKFSPTAVSNLLRVGVLANDVVDINGNLVVTGNCTEQNGACADYVFEPDYKLRSLEELALFISDNKHLPNVPSAVEMQEKGVNLAHMSGRLLEKVEELTLYTLQQEKTIKTLKHEYVQSTDNFLSVIESLNQRLLDLESR